MVSHPSNDEQSEAWSVISHPSNVQQSEAVVSHPSNVGQSEDVVSHPSNVQQSVDVVSHPSNVEQSEAKASSHSNVGQSEAEVSHPGSVGQSEVVVSHPSTVGQSEVVVSHSSNVMQSEACCSLPDVIPDSHSNQSYEFPVCFRNVIKISDNMSSNNCPEVSSKEEISHGESDDDYEASSIDDGQSDYEVSSHDDELSDYEASSDDLRQSDCEATNDDSISMDDLTEEEKVRDLHNKEIFFRKILVSGKTKLGKKKKHERVYNLRHSCLFCKKLFVGISQHLLFVHKKRPDVIKIRKIKFKDVNDSPAERRNKVRERKAMLDLLRIKGDHQHNLNVLAEKKGEFIVGRRPQGTFDVSEYGPCSNCQNWLKLSVLKIHQQKCRSKQASLGTTARSLKTQSSVMAHRVTSKASKALVDEVFSVMKSDAIGEEARSDPLIVAIGNECMIKNLGNRLMRKSYTSHAMRLLARLKIELNKMSTPMEGTSLEFYISPNSFEDVAKATLQVAKQGANDDEHLGSPSNALKLSHFLKRAANIRLAQAIASGNVKQKKDCKDFIRLMEIKYSTKVARVLLQERQYGKKNPLPLPRDIKKLSDYIAGAMETFNKEDHSFRNYRRAARRVETKLITYNRRRCGELQAML